ncbi:anthranilate synthase component I [Propionibacterium freudenreichii]|uniref:anthranilate synthase component I n=1 Tax=Propionibacterium freudenreichii TaxID=1744 RepID=UPI0005A5C2BD|nr:anthranilate synthase component I [Propionibacterium freudenreichii]MDK9348494.1 anthranilate synthase component I [Propionibacterium freudenreichii]MDK9627342.1 anthranilate synthase component I [Propionibacterium freudenreichii]MDK9653921.1 anthranilate synthase component I [Propionibacterium freudenreichii]CEI30988.1 anthranilate synthase component I [Propionibacterium freudenreichii]SBN40800.1 Anthranilate synthase component I [Propionibacterium freudenreichii]
MSRQLRIEPSLEGFREQAVDRRVVGVRTRLRADDLTPIALYEQLTGEAEGSFIFESVEQGTWSRWSFIGVRCPSMLVGRGNTSEWLGRPLEGIPRHGPCLNVLAATLRALHTPADPELPPFSSGLVGYLGWDVKRQVEPSLGEPNPDDIGVPDSVMMLATDMAVLDHHRGEVWLIANAINFNDTAEGVDEAYRDAVERVHRMATRLTSPRPALLASIEPDARPQVTEQRAPGEFEAMVEKAKEYVMAGDIFQVVPGQRFDVDVTASGFDIYRELRVANPSPYLFLLKLPGFDLIGSSPEALVTVKDGVATTHPIAGTRPRGDTEAEDRRLEDELLADEKERAEHLMLVDLGRNDLGRVCIPGTVTVTQFMHVGRYSYVMHLEAAVTGSVEPGLSALDVVMACFPAGTLSGAPKLRAMQIIDELESTARGPYGGVVGYFDFAGNADTAICIRTALVKDGVAHVSAGAGIVADSVPANENAESHNKAAAVLVALARANASHRITPQTLLEQS